jgi:5'-phosphate synthase pdxT subunit
MKDPVGLLALQGDFELHRQAFADLATPTRLVRRPPELEDCAALVIPGGESTTLARLVDRCGFRGPLREFARKRPIMGTCAGLILLARELAQEQTSDHGVSPLGLLDCVVQRNGYGRQVDSFSEDVSIAPLTGAPEPFLAVYIRAPRILAVGPDTAVVATRGEEPVAVQQGWILGLTFHPELTSDRRIHAAFLTRIVGS